MSTYEQFLEARSLSEALLLKHATEGSRHTDTRHTEREIIRSFSKLASQLGYSVSRLPASSTTGEAA